MKRTYILLALVFLIMAGGLVFFPDNNKLPEIKPEEVYSSLNLPFRYISTDKVAALMIRKDPALCLIDVREADEFNDFSLQGAINIPLSKMMEPDFQSILKQMGMDYIFYSNGDIMAENAWLIGTRLGLKNLYIMKGGLNNWVETIFNPKEPLQSAPSETWAQYNTRKAARQYFLGLNNSSVIETAKNKDSKSKTVKPLKPVSKSKSGEGC